MRPVPVAGDGRAGRAERAGPGLGLAGRLAYLAGTALVTSPQHRARDDRRPLRCSDISRSQSERELPICAFNRTAVSIGRGLHIGSLCSWQAEAITDVVMMSGVMLPSGFQSSFL
jgi:hypothetical protein